MKQFVFLLLGCLLLVTGCGQQLDPATSRYQEMVTALQKQTSFDTEFPFQIRVGVEVLDTEEFIYQIVVDDVTSTLTQVRAVALADDTIDDTYPSVGIYDDPLTLVPKKQIDTDKKGFYFVGYLSRNNQETIYTGCIKVLIEYQDEKGNLFKKYYRYQKETK